MVILRRAAVLAMTAALALAPAATRAGVIVTAAVADSYTVNEDATLVVDTASGVLANDSHGQPFMCVTSWTPGALAGSLGSGVAGDGSFTFTPNADFNGATSFDYGMAEYTSGNCPATAPYTAKVTITVTAVNDEPTVGLATTCSGGVTVDEDSGAFTDAAHCADVTSFGPSNESGQSLDAWIVTNDNPSLFSAAPSLSIAASTHGQLHFTPAANQHGSATVTVKARDSGGTSLGGDDTSAAVTFTLTVRSVNDAPTAAADSFIVLKDRTLNVGVPGVLLNDHDIDGDPLTAVKVTNPVHGVVVLASDGSFSYTPAGGYTGLDAFSYKAFDGSLSSPIRVVSLTVTAVPPVPTPTPVPTPVPTPTAEPTATPEPTLPEPTPTSEPSASVAPSPSAAPSVVPTAVPSPTPRATAAPAPAGGEGGGISLPVLLVIVLLVLLVGFGAAVYVPKWLAAQRGEPFDP